ncbi:MAG: acetyltransferase [Chloroflexi bacterium]|nr:acetyltransferase [Chloroflexota bacterium]
MAENPEQHAHVGESCQIIPPSIVGYQYRAEAGPAVLGSRCIIRPFSTIYGDVTCGDSVRIGHNVLIREHTTVGSLVVIGTGAVIDGQCTIGSQVKIESGVYIPTHTTIGNFVFIGPNATLTNDRYSLRRRDEYEPQGPIIEDHATIGANATILPGVRVGEGAMVAAGSVVTRDVPPWHLAVGVPAHCSPLPQHLREENRAKRW